MIVTAKNAQQHIASAQVALHLLTALHLNPVPYPDQTCPYDGQSYDYIIVGAGTAGCVLANRLLEDNNTTVLLIEAGDTPPIESDLPALMLYGKSKYDTWQYKVEDLGVARETRKQTEDDMSLGKILGGSSGISYLWYSTGSRHDYNNWAKTLNDSAWKWKNILPYITKSTKLEVTNSEGIDSAVFGKNGNVGLTIIPNVGNISAEPYFNFFGEAGHKRVSMKNGGVPIGYSHTIFTINNKIRSSAAVSYLVPKIDHPNLYVLQDAIVKKVIFDSCKIAIGVEVYAKTCGKKHIYIKSKIEVILSAGVVNSPKILMLSGIGRKKQLSKFKIHTIADLPVGEGLQDHVGLPLIFNMTNLKKPERPFDPRSFPATVVLGYAAVDKIKDYPDYQSLTFVNFPKFQMNYCVRTYDFSDPICDNLFMTSVNTETMFTIINKQTGNSRGNVTLASNDFRVSPKVQAGYFTVKEDLEEQALNVRDFLRIEQTETFKKLGGQIKDPKLPYCGKFNSTDLDYLKCYVRYMLISHHQYSSTCAMGSVVDARLRVYQVKRLRVVDASVMINPTAGGTLGSTIIIAEKAADMIKEDRKKYQKYCRN